MGSKGGTRGPLLKGWLGHFALVHPINVALSTLYALLQLLVFARVLGPDRFAEVILINTIGMVLMPLNVAAGRVNYVALREDIVLGRETSNWPHVLQLLCNQFTLLLLVSLIVPLILPVSGGNYVENLLFLAACLSTNYVLNDLQVTLWALDLNVRFVYLIILRSLLQYFSLLFMIINRSFLEFSLASLAVNIFTMLMLFWFLKRNTLLEFNFRQSCAFLAPASEHMRRLFSSMIASLSEMTVLALPYVMLTAVFGVGPALITYDAIMKFVRVITAGARMTTEVALAQITRDLVNGKPRIAWRRYLSIIGLCIVGSLVLAAALVIFENEMFTLLLGPNNVVPEGTGIVAGVVVVIAAAYQPSHYIVSVNNSRRLIGCFAAVAVIGFVLFSLVFLLGPSLIETIWAYACYFGLVTLALVTLSYLAIFGRGLPGKG